MEEATQDSSPLKLQDKVAVVTGGSRGIGRAISLHLASLGCKLVINYTANSVQANLLSSELNAASSTSRAVAVKADISDPLQVSRLFDAAESSFNSPVHIVVNSAGVLDSSYSSVSDTRGGESAGLWREDRVHDVIDGGGVEAGVRGVCGVQGGGGGDGEGDGQGAEREGDHGELCGAGAGGDGDVLRREDGGDGGEGGGGVSVGAVGGGGGRGAGGRVSGKRGGRVG
ncbi:hypothetical protein ACET3Z_009843 [Daucus carota]